MIAPLALALLAADPTVPPAPEVHVIDDKERVRLQQTDTVRLSLPTQDDVDAWNNPGLRVALGYGYGSVSGTYPALSFRSHSFALRPSVRLDSSWSAGLTLLYGTGPNGVRWSMTAEPTFHPWRQLSLSVGVGYGGLSVSDFFRGGFYPSDAQEVSRELGAAEPLSSCTGSALSSLARADYLFVVGPLFASGPFLQAHAQWTRCRESFGSTETDTGLPTTYTQWWRQTGLTFGWWFAWR
jgi:hypothetical protein